MDLVCLLLIVSAVLMLRAGQARASCALTLDGDADTVSRIRTSLAAFSDNTACVALRVHCALASGAIVLDLQDELGRSAHRTFASPDGAAAFLISWSRRPVLDARAPLVATARPSSGAAPATASGAAPAIASGAAPRPAGRPNDVRAAPASTEGEPRIARAATLDDDVETSAGIELGWVDRVRLRSELIAGGDYATAVARSRSTSLGGQLAAVHAGARTTVTSRASAVWVEGGASWDAAQLAKLHQDTAPFERVPADPFRNTMRLETTLPWPQ